MYGGGSSSRSTQQLQLLSVSSQLAAAVIVRSTAPAKVASSNGSSSAQLSSAQLSSAQLSSQLSSARLSSQLSSQLSSAASSAHHDEVQVHQHIQPESCRAGLHRNVKSLSIWDERADVRYHQHLRKIPPAITPMALIQLSSRARKTAVAAAAAAVAAVAAVAAREALHETTTAVETD